MNIQTKVITAKALRSSFCSTQSALLKDTFWDDAKLAEMVRNMQEEYKIFEQLVKEIKEEDHSVYEKQILGC